jgi:hypothetical protein
MTRIINAETKEVVSILKNEQSNSEWICKFIEGEGRSTDKILNLPNLHMLIEYYDNGEYKTIDCNATEEFEVAGNDYIIEWDLDEDEMEEVKQ